jgi:hypothetical protein
MMIYTAELRVIYSIQYNPMPGIKNLNKLLQNSNGSCGLSVFDDLPDKAFKRLPQKITR